MEPRKMWRRYLVTNTLFVGLALRAILTRPIFLGSRAPISAAGPIEDHS
jgi:hypothetical protein